MILVISLHERHFVSIFQSAKFPGPPVHIFDIVQNAQKLPPFFGYFFSQKSLDFMP